MNPRFKINLIGLFVALSSVLVGYSFGEPPQLAGALAHPVVSAAATTLPGMTVQAAAARRGALMRHLAMPYVSFASLTPRQES